MVTKRERPSMVLLQLMGRLGLITPIPWMGILKGRGGAQVREGQALQAPPAWIFGLEDATQTAPPSSWADGRKSRRDIRRVVLGLGCHLLLMGGCSPSGKQGRGTNPSALIPGVPVRIMPGDISESHQGPTRGDESETGCVPGKGNGCTDMASPWEHIHHL